MIYGNVFLPSEDYYRSYSAKECVDFLEQIQNQIITESSIEETSLIINEQVLYEAAGITKSDIESKAKPVANKIAKVIKEEGITETSKKTIAGIYEEFITNLSKSINIRTDWVCEKIGYEKNKDKYDISKLGKALELYLITGIAKFVVGVILLALHIYILNIVTEPLIEEIAKSIAIKKGYMIEYTAMLTLEIFNFGGKKLIGLAGKGSIIRRVKVAALHCTSLLIQYLTTNEEIQKKLKMDSEKDKEKLVFIGRVLGFLINVAMTALGTFEHTIKWNKWIKKYPNLA